MAQTSITLTASMRSNLSSLKSIQSQMDKTQERLSSGKKVNSAIDNASSYYQSRALTNRASDLDSLLDSMGQGIQTIQAANEGLEAITSYVEQLKSVANTAYALDPNTNSYATDLKEYQDQYNNILKEIATLAKDASYQGVNLLKGNKLTVMFNESRTHKLEVQSDDVIAKMAEKGTSGFVWGTDANGDQVGVVDWASDTAATYYKSVKHNMAKVTKAAGESVAGLYTVSGTGPYTWTACGVNDKADGTTEYYTITTSEDPAYNLQAAHDALANTATVMYEKDTTANYLDNTGSTRASLIDEALNDIATVNSYLRSYATELGNNFTIIETRQNFTDALIDVLETGSDNLVLADMNEESANYLALQTRQQLTINSLSLASQSAQSVLSLF